MTDETPHLMLPYILPAQAQKHVTHNEALDRLDLIVQAAVISRSETVPPTTPAEGMRYLLPASGGTGAFAGQAGKIAAFVGGGWIYITPAEGFILRVLDEDVTLTLGGSGWEPLASGTTATDFLGINAVADLVTRFAVGSGASLFSHDGNGHQVKVNKATATDTASLLFQTGFSGRAEMGLVGGNDFEIKVSPDGTAFTTALSANATTGKVTLAQGAEIGALVTGAAVTSSPSDTSAGKLLTVGAGPQQLAASVYHRGNALGSVGMASGVPTGALIETGTTATARWLRFADGTMICAGSFSGTVAFATAFAGFFRGSTAAVTFPSAFAAAPFVMVGNNTNSGADAAITGAMAVTTGNFTPLGIRGASVASAAYQGHYLAIGRWV